MARAEFTDFGKKVKMKLLERNMTQAELAEMVGCSHQYLHKILVGERSGNKYIKSICEILDMNRSE